MQMLVVLYIVNEAYHWHVWIRTTHIYSAHDWFCLHYSSSLVLPGIMPDSLLAYQNYASIDLCLVYMCSMCVVSMCIECIALEL